MKRMRVGAIALIPALVIPTLCLSAGPARSDKPFDDRGGVLYLTLAPELKYDPYETYCGKSATPLPSEAILQGTVGAGPQVAFLVASWPDSARPEMGAVSFGIRYPKGIEIIRWGVCHRTLSAPTNSWPLSGEGVAIAMAGGETDTSRTVELAWMIVVAHTPGQIELVPHPNPIFGAHFATTTDPKEAPIVGLGKLGFGRPGYAPTPSFPGPDLGAVCVRDTICVRISEQEAAYYGKGATWLGKDIYCTSNICRRDAPIGACCMPDATCTTIQRKKCTIAGGIFQGDATTCTPNPCVGKGNGQKRGKAR